MGEEMSTRMMRTPKEGERILAPTRRPDGTLRKPVRIRAGYTPQDEVAIYQSKGTLMRKAAESLVPPGYDPPLDSKPKTKSAKRNERKKEKKLQAALAMADKGKKLDSEEPVERIIEVASAADQHSLNSVESVTDGMTNLSVSLSTENVTEGMTNLSVSLSTEKIETSKAGDFSTADIDKRIRALKKKIRLAESQPKSENQSMKPEKLEKLVRVEGWREELKLLEDKIHEKVSQAS